MRKLKLFFACLLMAVLSIGQVWGAAATVYTSNVTLSSATTDGSTAAVKATDSKASISGTEYDAIKLGTNKNAGNFYIEVPASTTTLTLHAAGWNGKSNTLTLSTSTTGVSISPSDAQSLTANSGVSGSTTTYTITPDNTKEFFTFTLTGVSSAATIKLACSERCLIWGVNAETSGGGGGGSDPSLSVAPTSIDFGTVYKDATVESQTVAVTFANLTGDVTYSGLTSPFTASGTVSATGDEITIAADASTIGEYEQTLTVTSADDDKSATVTVTMNVVAAPEPTGTFALFSGALTEGDYVIYYDGKAMKNTVSSNRLDYTAVTPSENKITDPDVSLIWHIAASGDYWTIYNAAVEKYAAGTGTKNQAGLLADGTDNKSLWTASGSETYEFVNKAHSASSINANLRNNGTYGFACYASGTGGALTLYKKQLPAHAVTFTADPTGGSVAVSVGGSDISSGDQVEEGATVTITPTASTYYQIASVTQGGQAVEPVQGVYSFTMPSSDVAVAATFEYIPVTGLTLNKSALDLLVDAEETLSVMAVAPADAYNGVNWSSSATGIATVDADGKVTAKAEGTATITATSVVSGTVTATCAVTVSAPSGHEIGITSANGTVVATSDDEVIDIADVLKDVAVVLTATPNDGYTISGWTVVGAEYSVSQDKTTCSFTMPDDEVLVEVTYTHEVAVLKLHDANGESTFDSENTHYWKESVTLPTSAAACSKTFVGWSAESDHSSAPELGATYVLPNKGENHIYAVYATSGDDDVTITPSAVSGSEDPYSFTIDQTGYTLSARKNTGSTAPTYSSDGDVRVYAKGSVTLASTKAMKSIVFNISTQGLKRLAPITASTGTIATQASGDETVTWTGSATSVTFTVGDKADYGSDGSSKAGQLDFSTIDVVVEGEPSDYSTTCAPQLDAPTFSVAAGMYPEAQTIHLSAAAGATIYYTTDGTKPSTSSDVFSADIVLNTRATTTIKAIAVKTGYANSNVASAAYNINLPFTVAEAIAIIPNNYDKRENTYIDGIVCTAGTEVNSDGTMKYYISDDGTETSRIRIYDGKGLNNADFSATTDLKVGDKVRVFGKLNNYQGSYDVDNSYLTSLEVATVSSVAISGTAKTAYSLEDNSFSFAGLIATATYSTGYVKDVTVEATWTANGENPYTVAEGGDVTVIATFGGKSDTKVVTVTYTSKTVASISLSYNAKTVYIGEECPEPVVTASYEEAIDPEDVTDLATFDKSAYDNTKAGTYTINVSYQGKNASYDVTVKAIANDQATAYTAAEINDIIANIYKSTTASTYDVYVKGIVVENAYTTSGNSVYHISADGTTTNQFYIYGAKYFDPSTSATGNVKAGDDVIVKGNIQYYNSTTPELKSSTVVYQLRAGALSVENVAAFEVGTADLAEADLTINRNGSNGAITFSCDENDALEVVENGTKLHAKGEAIADVTVRATMAADNTEGQINFTEASTTFTVHVVPAQTRYTVTFSTGEAGENVSGNAPEAIDDQLENAEVTLPACTWTWEGHKFTGWAVTYGENVPVEVENNQFNMPAAAVTVTAQWAEGSEANWVAATWASANNISSNTNLEGDYATIAVDANVSLTWSKATGNNVPAYNSSNTEARLYQNTTLQVAGVEGKLIKKVTFTFRGNNTGTISASVGTYSSNEWIGLANAITFTNTGSAAYIKSIAIEYINGTVTSLTIANINLKLSDGETALTITKNVDATIIYEGLDESVATIADNKVTPVAEGSTTVTARIAQGSNYTAAQTTFTITVAAKTIPEMSFPQAEYNANLGGSFTAPTLTKPEGVSVAYSSDNAAVSVDANTGAITINAEGTAVITATSVENDDYSVGTASYTLHVIDPTKDVLTASAIEAGSSYVDWGNKTFGSTVKYAGNSMTGSGDHAGAIQMRNTNPSGIVTTSAIGYLKSISATETSNGNNTLEIYAKGSAYESSADLYSSDEAVKGVKIGTIAAGGGAMTFVTGKAYSDNYKYIGIKANGGAVYYDDITITWTPVVFEHFAVTYKAGEATGDDKVESIEEGSNISLKAADTFEAPEGKIFAGWLLEGEQNVREAGSKYTVTAAATFTAQWVSVYTITYTAGDGTGDDVIVPNVQAGDYELADNTFTAPENMEFAGWKLNNAGETLAAGANYNVSGNASFTAQWSIVKQAADLAYTTTSYIITRGREFEAPELTNPHGLAVTYSGNNDKVATVNATTGALTLKGVVGEVTVTATSAATDYYYAGEASYTLKVKDANLSGGWLRLTSSNALVDGMNVIIAEHVSIQNGEIKTMGAQNTNNRGQKVGALQNDTLISDEGTAIFTLVKVGENTFAFKAADNKYLYAASSGSNHLKSQAKIDGNATWTISLSGDGKATITAQGENTRNLMRYNKTNGLFSCYASGQQDIALYSKTVAVSGNTNASTLDEYADVVVADGGKLVINEGTKPLGNITGNVEVNAPLQAEGVHLGVNNTMEVNSTVNVPSFSISVQLGGAGQATNVNVSGSGSIAAPEGYVDMALTDNGRGGAGQWHSFTVPFPVDALNGIYNAETGDKLINEKNYAIMDYHSDIRANGEYGWKKYRGILQPGTFYLITVDGSCPNLRFMKTQGSNYVAANNIALTYQSGTGANTDYGWCGVGNQNMFGGYVNFTVQILNSTGTAYDDVDPNAQSFSACIPFFIQIGSTGGTLVMSTTPQNLAPARVQTDEIKNQRIYFGNENFTDRLTVSASEDALNQYEIGKDLLKMTVSNTPTVPQIFGSAYGNKLCRVNAPMANDQAEVALDLYAPAAGEYTISASENENATVYLVRNGSIIWNLSSGAYTAEFAKGNNAGYSIRIVKAPQITTGVENSGLLNGANGVQKVVIDNHVYILRNEQMYNVNGQVVK